MASLALELGDDRISIEEFLAMDFAGRRAELDDGVIRMMSGGSEQHSRIAVNILIALGNKLRGSGCRPYGSDLAMQTGVRSLRLPDVSVYCRPLQPGEERQRLIGDPNVVVEVLSPSTASIDLKDKLAEYQSLEGIDAIVFVDPDRERIRLVQRTPTRGWNDEWLPSGDALVLSSLDLVIPHADIFARD